MSQKSSCALAALRFSSMAMVINIAVSLFFMGTLSLRIMELSPAV